MPHQPPPLTLDTFRALAAQAGFDAADPHVEELFPFVKQMMERLELLQRANVEGAEPPPFDASAGWGTR